MSALVLLGVDAVDQLPQSDKRQVVVRHLQIFELKEQVSGCCGKPSASSHQPSDVGFDRFAVADENIPGQLLTFRSA